MFYLTKILNSNKYDKDTLHAFDADYEFCERLISRLRAIVNKHNFDMNPRLRDPDYLKVILMQNSVDNAVLSELSSSEFGQGYMLGFISATEAMEALKELEDEDV